MSGTGTPPQPPADTLPVNCCGAPDSGVCHRFDTCRSDGSRPPADTQQGDEQDRVADLVSELLRGQRVGEEVIRSDEARRLANSVSERLVGLHRRVVAARPSADTETGAWVCARCGESPPAHAAAGTGTGRCVYEPIWRPSADTAPLRRVRELADDLRSEGTKAFWQEDVPDESAAAMAALLHETADRIRAALDGPR